MNRENEIIRKIIATLYKNRQKVYCFIYFILIFGIIMLVTKEDELLIIAGYFLIAAFGSFLVRYVINALFLNKKR
ncbi:MAG TPA: hypothetical protein GXZ95_04455 [Mollicutes bacterium]|nr:hypothetical protein [Mollicutes bacterium]